MKFPVIHILLASLVLFASTDVVAGTKLANPAVKLAEATGREIMEAVYNRHQQYPFVYEEQSMILEDRHGNRETRKLKRYSRVESDGRINFLLIFESPEEVKGVSILAVRSSEGRMSQSLYLPAFGAVMIHNEISAKVTGSGGEGEDPVSHQIGEVKRPPVENHRARPVDKSFLGTDFSLEDIAGEVLDDYVHVRREDLLVDGVAFFVVDVYPLHAGSSGESSPLRRHYILQGNLFISRTDHLDELGRLRKVQTYHDLNPVNGEMWRANMILMDNEAEHHRTIIKVDKRVFSPDYVPASMFTSAWLFKNYPQLSEKSDSATIGGMKNGMEDGI